MPFNSAAATPLRILVTGAGGLIGRAVCGALAQRGHAVAGLLRRRAALHGSSMEAERDTGPLTAGAVALFAGDVAAPGLGLAAEAKARLAALDLVVHCAAVTGFNLSEEVYHRVNTGGTAQVLEFAAAGKHPVPLLHVSTAYVCGVADGEVAEAPVTTARFNNGYEASKAAAEALVLAAQRSGHMAAVARPSVVVGRWDGRRDRHLRNDLPGIPPAGGRGACACCPSPPAPASTWCRSTMWWAGWSDIAERMADANGRIFHLASGRSQCP